jgi:hypothetical protein
MLNDDWTNWVDTEKEARDWKARFGVLLRAAEKNIEAPSQIIEADALNRMRLAAGKSSQPPFVGAEPTSGGPCLSAEEPFGSRPVRFALTAQKEAAPCAFTHIETKPTPDISIL